MHCPIQTSENAEVLLAYCSRTLDPDAAAALERHMESCAACRETLSAQQSVWAALDSWQPSPVSADFDRRLYRRIAERDQTAWWRWFFEPLTPRPLGRVLPVAAACLALVAVVLMQAPGDVAPSPRLRVETVNINVEQLETTLEDLYMLEQLAPKRTDANPQTL